MKRVAIAVGLALVVATACGNEGQEGVPASVDDRSTATTEKRPTAVAEESALARTYVSEICEPFAKYLEDAIRAGFPELEGLTSPDDIPVLFRRLRASSQRTHADFTAVQPPAAIRDIHEQVLAALEAEIAAYQAGEGGLEHMVFSDVLPLFGGISPPSFFPPGVPEEYEEAWERECVPRLIQIPGASDIWYEWERMR